MSPEEVERVIGKISEKDIMDFARRKLWDQDVAVSAVGSIEGQVSSMLSDILPLLTRTVDFWITTGSVMICLVMRRSTVIQYVSKDPAIARKGVSQAFSLRAVNGLLRSQTHWCHPKSCCNPVGIIVLSFIEAVRSSCSESDQGVTIFLILHNATDNSLDGL